MGHLPLDVPLPATDVARTGEPVFIEDPARLRAPLRRHVPEDGRRPAAPRGRGRAAGGRRPPVRRPRASTGTTPTRSRRTARPSSPRSRGSAPARWSAAGCSTPSARPCTVPRTPSGGSTCCPRRRACSGCRSTTRRSSGGWRASRSRMLGDVCIVDVLAGDGARRHVGTADPALGDTTEPHRERRVRPASARRRSAGSCARGRPASSPWTPARSPPTGSGCAGGSACRSGCSTGRPAPSSSCAARTGPTTPTRSPSPRSSGIAPDGRSTTPASTGRWPGWPITSNGTPPSSRPPSARSARGSSSRTRTGRSASPTTRRSGCWAGPPRRSRRSSTA